MGHIVLRVEDLGSGRTLFSRGSSAQNLEARIFMALLVEPSEHPCPAALQSSPQPTVGGNRHLLQTFQTTGDLTVAQVAQGGERCRERS